MSRLKPLSEDHRKAMIAQKREALRLIAQVIVENKSVLNGEISGQNLFEGTIWLEKEIQALEGESYLRQLERIARKYQDKS